MYHDWLGPTSSSSAENRVVREVAAPDCAPPDLQRAQFQPGSLCSDPGM